MFSPWQAVRILRAIMTALPIAGAAVFLAHASSMHPRLAPQVRSAGQAGSVTQAASARQGAPAVVGGPAGVQVKGAAVANAATGQVLWSVDLNTELPIGSLVKDRGAFYEETDQRR